MRVSFSCRKKKCCESTQHGSKMEKTRTSCGDSADPFRWQGRAAWTATKLCTPLRDPIPLRCAVSPSLRASVLARSTVGLPNNSRCPSRQWRRLSPEVRDEEPRALQSAAGNALKLDHTWQLCPAKVLLGRYFRELKPFPKHPFSELANPNLRIETRTK